ncbi:MAG: sigma-70 family RNA polymerase sigma factor [Bacteroidetes bacterium]|nr:sigma-70 family RNA polymerase sigma factor [Bacteroidota bacterium]
MRFLRSRKVVQQDDSQIITAFRETGDTLYIGILFDRYCHLVFAVSMNYMKNEEDSKDVVLYVFEKLGNDLKKYDIKNFSSWLYSVTKHYCLRLLNKKPYSVHIDEELNYLVTEEDETDHRLTDRLLLFLDEAISELNEEQRTCIRLFYLEEKSYKEIEVITGYAYEKVKSHIQNGKRNMKIYLLKKNGKKR